MGDKQVCFANAHLFSFRCMNFIFFILHLFIPQKEYLWQYTNKSCYFNHK